MSFLKVSFNSDQCPTENCDVELMVFMYEMASTGCSKCVKSRFWKDNKESIEGTLGFRTLKALGCCITSELRVLAEGF